MYFSGVILCVYSGGGVSVIYGLSASVSGLVSFCSRNHHLDDDIV